MRGWLSLFKKELRTKLFTILVSILLISGWEIFLMTKTEVWPLGLSFALGFLPLTIFPLIMLIQGYQSFRKEWNNQTIYLLKSLPRKGYEVVSSKLVSSTLIYIVLTLYTLGLHMFFHWYQVKYLLRNVPPAVANNYSHRMAVIAVLIYLAVGVVPYVLSQFSYLVSCFFSKFRWLVSIVVFILSHYLLLRLGGLVARLFNWMPDIPLDAMWTGAGGEQSVTIYLGSGPIIAALIIIIGFFFTGSWILEKQLDV